MVLKAPESFDIAPRIGHIFPALEARFEIEEVDWMHHRFSRQKIPDSCCFALPFVTRACLSMSLNRSSRQERRCHSEVGVEVVPCEVEKHQVEQLVRHWLPRYCSAD